MSHVDVEHLFTVNNGATFINIILTLLPGIIIDLNIPTLICHANDALKRTQHV